MSPVVAAVALRGSYDVADNVARHRHYLDLAARSGAELVVFPEISLQGYPIIRRVDDVPSSLRAAYRNSEPVPDGANVRYVLDHARSLGVHVVFGVTERGDRPGVVYNTAVLGGPDGYIGRFRKVHLGLEEQEIWRAGSEWPVFDTAIGKLGLLICYDLMWPEACRELTLQGADILVMPTGWTFGYQPKDPIETNASHHQYVLFCMARAAENQRWLVSSNVVGELGGTTFFGRSLIVSPNGFIEADTGEGEGIVVADVDIGNGTADAMAAWMGARLVRDRRPATYRTLAGDRAVAIDG